MAKCRFFNAFIPYYLETQDKDAVEVWRKFYSSLSPEEIGLSERHPTNIEILLRLYDWTGDKALLQKAIDAYEAFDSAAAPFSLPNHVLTSGEKVVP